eukprot:CAMPEP_0119467242 /NCGR_PEP_ID=MMETSP1344-20130328/1519_1 /TAXON_ID=236787 /ORGANISM="Florenciella parvula, Strain CCMP2471" /LENGTH=58 /DNA_ID=CAMNT_0007499597 /DNA_START=64 /DNA_END=240 /DNA_ORIENTATION=+
MSRRSNGLASSASGGAGWLGCSAAGAFLVPVDVASSARGNQLARNQKGEPCTEPPVAH